MTAKSMGDKIAPQGTVSDSEAASALAQGHPKSKAAPVGFGMKDRTKDSLGARNGDCADLA